METKVSPSEEIEDADIIKMLKEIEEYEGILEDLENKIDSVNSKIDTLISEQESN